MTAPESTRSRGRPGATSHAEIERVAFDLFNEQGFAETTMREIADAVGVGRRTLFRYFESKNDIPWGQFDRTLDGFREILAAMPEDLPLHQAVHHGVVAFNDFPADAQESHRARMRLILETPELQAHSVLRYREWRAVVAEFAAGRMGTAADDPLAQLAGHVALALALAAYERWLASDELGLTDAVGMSMRSLERYLAL